MAAAKAEEKRYPSPKMTSMYDAGDLPLTEPDLSEAYKFPFDEAFPVVEPTEPDEGFLTSD